MAKDSTVNAEKYINNANSDHVSEHDDDIMDNNHTIGISAEVMLKKSNQHMVHSFVECLTGWLGGATHLSMPVAKRAATSGSMAAPSDKLLQRLGASSAQAPG